MYKGELTAEIVIPSYNRLHILQDTVRKIRQLYPDTHLCIGLQGQIPNSDFQLDLESNPTLRIERLAEPSTTKTLNYCIETSPADIILILDDDAVPCSGWLDSHISAFSDNPNLPYTSGREIRITGGCHIFSEATRIITEAVCGLFLKTDTKLNGHIVGWINRAGLLFGNFNQPGTCRINSPRGCNMAVRKDLFLSIGKFNQNFRGNAWGFEGDFGLRMAKVGNYGRYIGGAVVMHYEVPSGGSRSESKKQWFKDFIFNNKLLISNLGIQAWIGAVPRLLKKLIFN